MAAVSHPQVSTVLIQSTSFVFLSPILGMVTEGLDFKLNSRYGKQCLTQTKLGYVVGFMCTILLNSAL